MIIRNVFSGHNSKDTYVSKIGDIAVSAIIQPVSVVALTKPTARERTEISCIHTTGFRTDALLELWSVVLEARFEL